MKKLLLLYSTLLFSYSELSNILSDNQNALIETKKDKIELDTKKLEHSWINPIRVQYGKNYSTQFGGTTQTGQFIISVDQPIFKMGGIWEAIKYAKALGRANAIDVELQRRKLITEALTILYNIKKSNLQIEKLNLLIKNDELDILIQKESYEAGLTNRTLYDRALLKRNQDITSKLELELQITKLKNSFSLLSDKSPETITLPKFKMIDIDRYKSSQLELKRDRFHLEEKRHSKYMVVTKYLPEISVTGRYINEDKNPLFNNSKIETSYYNYGFKVSLAININSYRDIESSKIDYIKAKISLEEQKKRVENRYYLVKKRLEIIDQKIALSIDDAQNYANMLRVAREKEMAGDSTSYDTKIVENSLRVRELDQDIYRYDIELELLSLYENVEGVLELGR